MLSVVPRMEFGGTPPLPTRCASFLRTAGVRPTLNAIFIFCLYVIAKPLQISLLDKTGTDVNLS